MKADMKSVLTIAVASTLGLAALPAVVSAAEYGDVATVISATPIVERISVPRRDCRVEQVATYEERRVRSVQEPVYDNRSYSEGRSSGAGAVLGAIVGGVIGHQFGNSSGGRDRGTAAGALLGGVIGNSIERDNGGYREYGGYNRAYDNGYRRTAYDVERVPVTRDVQRCQTVSEYREEIRGYDVRYRYHNREYTTRLAYDPGPTMQVNVDVRPSYRAPAPVYDRY